jgi:hypothetical protein
MSSQLISPEDRSLTLNVVVIDCGSVSTTQSKYVYEFLHTAPKRPCPRIRFKCLHGDISDPWEKLCSDQTSSSTKPLQLQEVVKSLISHHSVIGHLVTTKPFSITSKCAYGVGLITKLFIWTLPSNLDGGAFDIRKRYWYDPSKMEVRFLKDMGNFWSAKDEIPYKFQETNLSSIASWFARMYESNMPDFWV